MTANRPRRSRGGAPTREAKLARRLLWMIPTSFILLAVGTRLVVTSDFVSRELAIRIAEQLANRTGSSVQLSGVKFGWSFAPCLQHLEIYRYHGPFKLRVATEEACVERWGSALGSGFHAVRVELHKPSIELSGSEAPRAGPSVVEAKPDAPGERRGRTRGTLREMQVVFDDLRLRWDAMPLPAKIASGSFGPIDGTVTVQLRGKSSAATISIREPVTDSRFNGRATPTPEGLDFSAGVEGDLVSLFKDLLESSNLDIRRMPSRGRVGAKWVSKEKSLTLDVDLEQYDVDLANRAVAKERIAFSAREKARIHMDLDDRSMELQEGIVEMNGIPVVLSLSLSPGETSPAFAFRANVNTTPLARMLRSVPGSQAPDIAERISPEVRLAISFSVSGELRDPSTWQPKLEHGLEGLDQPGAVSGLEFLRGPFEYHPLTPDGRTEEPRLVGPTTPNWVPYKRIPYVLRRAVMVSEDATFPFHRGIEIDEMKQSIQKTFETGERARGGSTISQQLVKNLFLSRDRTALRKVLELLLTFQVESVLTKDDIFEVYMNIIEWGPSIYGVKVASEHFFGRPPDRLTPLEMAYLATIIPSPIPSYENYENGTVSRAQMGKIYSLLERLNRLGQLPDQALAEAKASRIRFVRRGERSKGG